MPYIGPNPFLFFAQRFSYYTQAISSEMDYFPSTIADSLVPVMRLNKKYKLNDLAISNNNNSVDDSSTSNLSTSYDGSNNNTPQPVSNQVSRTVKTYPTLTSNKSKKPVSSSKVLEDSRLIPTDL